MAPAVGAPSPGQATEGGAGIRSASVDGSPRLWPGEGAELPTEMPVAQLELDEEDDKLLESLGMDLRRDPQIETPAACLRE
eukprot:8635818-Lingulodinium_polyedra.AAC.1